MSENSNLWIACGNALCIFELLTSLSVPAWTLALWYVQMVTSAACQSSTLMQCLWWMAASKYHWQYPTFIGIINPNGWMSPHYTQRGDLSPNAWKLGFSVATWIQTAGIKAKSCYSSTASIWQLMATCLCLDFSCLQYCACLYNALALWSSWILFWAKLLWRTKICIHTFFSACRNTWMTIRH